MKKYNIKLLIGLLCGSFLTASVIYFSNIKNVHATACVIQDADGCEDEDINEGNTEDKKQTKDEYFETFKPHSKCVKGNNGFYRCGDCDSGYIR